jgi:hypothetical protein
MSEEVKISITADSASAEPALKGTAAGVATIGATSKAAAPAVRGLAGTIDTLRLSLTTLQKAFGLLAIITLTISWLTALWGVCKTVYGWFKKLEDTSVSAAIDRMASSAKAATDQWKKLNDEMARNAAQRKAMADDTQKESDATYAMAAAKIEEKLQSDLASTTDPAKRAEYQGQADASKARLANQSKVIAARAARSNAEADLLQNERDIASTLQVAQDAANTKFSGTPQNPEDAKKYAKAQDDAYALKVAASEKLKTLRADRTRLLSAYESSDTRVVEAETISRAGMTQAQREAADRQAQREIADRQVAAEALASASKASILDKAKAASAQSKRDQILASAADKRAGVTVDAPRAATDVGAIGGYMGGNMQNAARMAEQRAAALEAIQREAATLLAQIKEGLTE